MELLIMLYISNNTSQDAYILSKASCKILGLQVLCVSHSASKRCELWANFDLTLVQKFGASCHLSRTRVNSSWCIDVGYICKIHPTKFRPAATKGAIKVRVAIRKWRDTYYSDTRTCQRNWPRASSCKPFHKIPFVHPTYFPNCKRSVYSDWYDCTCE
jgi:hypothetical protein